MKGGEWVEGQKGGQRSVSSRHEGKTVIAWILRKTHYNRKVTAQRLQISYKALFYKIHQYGLVWKMEAR
jgi:DNA-binding NtrC family response regulator